MTTRRGLSAAGRGGLAAGGGGALVASPSADLGAASMALVASGGARRYGNAHSAQAAGAFCGVE